MERPTVRQLEYIVAVAEHGHFGRAAAAVGVSQPGLSSQIQAVEKRLGVTLFERTTRAVQPTEAGRAIAAWSRSILLSIDEMMLDATQHVGALVGRLRLGAIPTIAPYLLPAVLADARRLWPDARLEIVEAQSEDLVAAVESGDLDLGLLATPYDTGQLTVHPIGDEPFVLALPEEHELSGEPSVDVSVLSSLSVLLLSEGHCLRDHARSACEIAGSVEDSEVRDASLSTLCQMVASGIGVTLLPAGAVPVEARAGSGLATVPFRTPAPGRGLALISRQTDPRASHYEDLADRLRADPIGDQDS